MPLLTGAPTASAEGAPAPAPTDLRPATAKLLLPAPGATPRPGPADPLGTGGGAVPAALERTRAAPVRADGGGKVALSPVVTLAGATTDWSRSTPAAAGAPDAGRPADRMARYADRPVPMLPALAGLAALIVGIVRRRRR